MMSHQRGPKVCVRSFAGQGWCPASGSPNLHIQGPKAAERESFELNQARGPAPLEFGTSSSIVVPGKQNVTLDGNHPTIRGVFLGTSLFARPRMAVVSPGRGGRSG
jgi:hypothetical protein